MRITSITAVHYGADGTVLVDVILDHAGAPEGVDLAWQPKHYLGVPVPAAVLATVNLAHVVAPWSSSQPRWSSQSASGWWCWQAKSRRPTLRRDARRRKRRPW